MKIINRAIGSCLAKYDKAKRLSIAFLPGVWPIDSAREIAATVNSLTQDERKHPYSIVINEDSTLLSEPNVSDLIEVPLSEALTYRHGSRLVIVGKSSNAIASVDGSFTTVMTETFPESATGELSLVLLAEACMSHLVSQIPDSQSIQEISDESISRLAAVFDALETAYRTMSGNAARDWNGLWYDHVSLGLENLLSTLLFQAENGSTLTLKDFFEEYTFAAFGLPKPNNRIALVGKTGNLGRDISEAFEIWWGTRELVLRSIPFLNSHRDTQGEFHQFGLLDWNIFERSRLSFDSSLIALGDLASTGIVEVEAFATFTENQFFNPASSSPDSVPLEIFDEAELSKRFAYGRGNSSHIAFLQGGTEGEISSELLNVRVPLLTKIELEDVSTDLSLSVNDGRIEWNGTVSKSETLGLVLQGRFTWLKPKDLADAVIRPFTVKLAVSPDDPLSAFIDIRSSGELALIPPSESGVAVWALKGRSRPKGLKQLTTFSAASLDSETSYTLPENGIRIALAAWGKAASVGGRPMNILENFNNLHVTEIQSTSTVEIQVDEDEYFIHSPELLSEIQSPIIAAIKKQPLTSSAMDDENLHSLRGRLESYLSNELDSESHLDGLFHTIIPTEGLDSLDRVSFEFGFATPVEISDQFRSMTNRVSATKEFLNSPEVEAFKKSFKELDIISSLLDRSSPPGSSRDLPSRTSWRHLWDTDRELLDAYLNAYADMVSHAQSTKVAANIFIATYPFSFSVWNLSKSGKASSVLLSPLHPLRLAWLASVESTLFSSDFSEDLAGTVEGWNFPIVGPGSTQSGWFVAVPTDNGHEQVFLGWSMLVNASLDEPENLEPPIYVAGMYAPGAAGGGMNSSSTTNALSAYRRINPHISTLSIDLASASLATRLREMDSAILKTTKLWSDSLDSRLPGGIRVWDSLNRLGDPPLEEAQIVAAAQREIPSVWTRYNPNEQQDIRSNIRLLQDSGVKVAVKPSQELPNGLLGSAPLRRFEALAGADASARYSHTRPTLRSAPRNESFAFALSIAEQTIQKPIIQAAIHKSVLINENADWTVTGESIVSPSALVSLLDTDSTGQKMLWEWRPPFLDSKDGDFLERRPFLAIAKIPNSFRSQLSSILGKALGRETTDSEVNKLLGKLGARGVGLSSLLSMGGTHASGALGFYLAISLLDTIRSDDDFTFVLPIDACEPFLKALAGNKSNTELTKRADLLAIKLTADNIQLTAIEIKLYGLGANNPATLLPEFGDRNLFEAQAQVDSTNTMVIELAQRFSEISNGSAANRAVWINGFMALLEASIKMAPPSDKANSNLYSYLSNFVEGKSRVTVSAPLVTYFAHEAHARGGQTHLAQFVDAEGAISSSNQLGIFSANLSAVIASISGEVRSGDALLEDWRKLVEWASQVQSTSNGSEVPDKGPESDDGSDDELPPESGAGPENGESVDEPVAGKGTDEPKVESGTPSGNNDNAGPGTGTGTGTEPDDEDESVSLTIKPPGIKVKVGKTLNSISDSDLFFWPANTSLNQMNIGVVGDLGTGKTQLLRGMVLSMRESAMQRQDTPLSFLIFDYKDDYTELDFLNRVGGEVLRPEGIPLNIFALEGEYSKPKAFKKAAAFCDILAKIYQNVGPVQKDNLIDAILSQFEINNGLAPTLGQVLSRYKLLTKKPDSVTAILNKFVQQTIFSEDRSALLDFEELISNKVLVLALNELGADRDTQNALVVLFLDFYYEYMLKSSKWPFEGNEPQLRKLNSYLLVDEATNIMAYDFPVLSRLLLQGRQFGVGVILASQYLSHFKTAKTNYGEPLLTWIIHKVPTVKVQELVSLGIPKATAEVATRISSLKIHEAFFSTFGVSGVFMRGLPYFEM